METSEKLLDAVKVGDIPAVRALLAEDASLARARTAGGVSAVLLAVYYGRHDLADLLAEHAAPLDLFEAAALGRLDQVRAHLLAQPDRINAYGADGHTPLGLVCYFGHEGVAAYLIEQGADVNRASQNAQQVRPLHAAAASGPKGHFGIVKLLVEHGAEVNAVQADGFMPLHEAAQNGDRAMVELLLDHGAEPAARSAKGLTAADYAREGGHTEIAALLESLAQS